VNHVVRTSSGPVSGIRPDAVGGVDGRCIVRFLGIPFAAPPVGTARWRRPEPPEPWAAVRPCTDFGPVSPQNPSPLETMLGVGTRPMSEDCLSLNVWTPACDDQGRAVLVWVHGGGFAAGTGSVAWYDGSRLATVGDVVVVTVNYRLGALGWLHLEHLLGAEFAGSGNLGLLDQMAALGWVRDNIAGFGGDPGRVTVFGESAGAMSIGALLGAPAAAGLFAGAIAQSGAAHTYLPTETASWVTEELLTELGLSSAGADALLDLPIDALLAAQQAIIGRLLKASPPEQGRASGTFSLPFQPVLDDTVLSRPPLEAVRAGTAAGIRILVGSTTEEWNLFHLVERTIQPMTEDGLARRCVRLLDPANGDGAGAAALDLYRRNRPGASLDDVWVAVATDWVFRIPALRLAEAQAVHQRATWLYEFSFRSTAWGGGLGACHALEVPFVFDNLHQSGVELFVGPLTDGARRLATVTSLAWLAFARSGAPGHGDLPDWPAYAPGRRATMELGDPCALHDDPHGDERALWDDVL